MAKKKQTGSKLESEATEFVRKQNRLAIRQARKQARTETDASGRRWRVITLEPQSRALTLPDS